MAGGSFDMNVSKVRPGTYVNVTSKRNQKPSDSVRGTVVLPLIGYSWGKNGEIIKIAAESPDAEIQKIGRSIFDENDHMLLIRETLKNAITCYVYIINTGKAATITVNGIIITARCGGTRGNDIAVSSVENVSGGFDIAVYLGTEVIESYYGVISVSELIANAKNKYVTFSATDEIVELRAFAVAKLLGGTDKAAENADLTQFLDKSESIIFNTMCFPVEENTLQTACIAKIKYLREKVGKTVQAVLPTCTADTEGIINLTNSVILEGKELSVSQTCAWVAGVTAAATKVQSNTYVEYKGATGIIGGKTHEAAEAAIKNGEFFFSVAEGEKVVVEYDINSLHTFTPEKTEDYRKNRVLRVYDSFTEDLHATFPPNKYNNDEEGWSVMEGMGKALLQRYGDTGAISNVNLDEDFYIDRNSSHGDETYFNVGLQAVDSAEKLYFSVSTR